MWGVLCGVYYVGCIMWGVLCGVYYVGCIMWGVLCGVYYVGCIMWVYYVRVGSLLRGGVVRRVVVSFEKTEGVEVFFGWWGGGVVRRGKRGVEVVFFERKWRGRC